jgi:predicted SAM-dependent methyltransferase
MSDIKLNIGSGSSHFDEFLNVDFDNNFNPDYVLDIGKNKWPWEDNSVCEVKAHHVLEHLGDPDFFHCLKELYRVCKSETEIEVIVPHHRHDVFLNDPTHKRPITIDGMNLFSKEYNRHCDAVGDHSSQLGYYYGVDFKIINYKLNVDAAYQSIIQNIKPGSIEEKQFQMAIREKNNMIVEVIFIWKVIK